MSLGGVFQKLLRPAVRHFCQKITRKGGLIMGRRKLELVFGAVSGAVGLLVALYTAVIATKE